MYLWQWSQGRAGSLWGPVKLWGWSPSDRSESPPGSLVWGLETAVGAAEELCPPRTATTRCSRWSGTRPSPTESFSSRRSSGGSKTGTLGKDSAPPQPTHRRMRMCLALLCSPRVNTENKHTHLCIHVDEHRGTRCTHTHQCRVCPGTPYTHLHTHTDTYTQFLVDS